MFGTVRHSGLENSELSVTELSYEEALSRIGRRAFGGAEVAVGPEDEVDKQFFVEGPFLAGAGHAVRWLSDRIKADDSRPAILVLLGAPGNGKSFLVQDMVRSLRKPTAESPLHQRTYRYRLPNGKGLTVVNDASIPIPASGLPEEIDQVLDEGGFMVINVNRGILYQEFKRATAGPGMEILRWIENGKSRESTHESLGAISVEQLAPAGLSTLRAASVKVGDRPLVDVCLVILDSCSLFEADVEVEVRSGLPSSPPRLREIVLPRLFGTRGHERSVEFSEETPAGRVLGQFVARIPSPDGPTVTHDPFGANLKSLGSTHVRRGLQTVLRAGEVATSRRFSYRELWGAIALLTIGDEKRRVGSRDMTPAEWLERNGEPEDHSRRLDWMIGLANLRLHQSIFGSPLLDGSRLTGADSPVLGMTLAVDPVQDVLSRRRDDSEGSVWSRKIYDVFYGRAAGVSILSDLLSQLEVGSPMHDYVTEFDHLLDSVVVDALDRSDEDEDVKESDRRRLIYWYSSYLVLMCAVTYGDPAFFSELADWVKAYQQSANQRSLPERLKKGLLALLLPQFEGSEAKTATLLPLFDSRIDPVVAAPIEPKLVIRLETTPRVASSVVGDQILVDISVGADDRGGGRMARLELDFDLLREALTCSGNHVGRTENGRTATPRIERFRSALLSSNRAPVHAVLARGVYETLSFRAKEGRP